MAVQEKRWGAGIVIGLLFTSQGAELFGFLEEVFMIIFLTCLHVGLQNAWLNQAGVMFLALGGFEDAFSGSLKELTYLVGRNERKYSSHRIFVLF